MPVFRTPRDACADPTGARITVSQLEDSIAATAPKCHRVADEDRGRDGGHGGEPV